MGGIEHKNADVKLDSYQLDFELCLEELILTGFNISCIISGPDNHQILSPFRVIKPYRDSYLCWKRVGTGTSQIRT